MLRAMALKTLTVSILSLLWLTGALDMTQAAPAQAEAAEPDQKPNMNRPSNRLAKESSPYLRQHASNPVDWYPWGPEAFEEARRRGVPIFLSIGYSTCYWCHVMERESFEDESIARHLNERFVCIKVDREERPDVDAIYMRALQLLLGGGGGWPLNVWLTPPGARGEDDPGLQPFYAGTYFPPQPAYGRPSLKQASEGISDAWRDQREQVLEQGARVTEALQLIDVPGEVRVRLDDRQVGQTLASLLAAHDKQHGGFGGAPKFPQPVLLDFLLEVRPAVTDNAVGASLDRVIRTSLDGMGTGGIFDHVGGGFHRYSVDAQWVVPHFEKMLYDNALLASLYTKSFAMTRDAFDREIVQRTLDFILREMTSPEGGFYSALDAEVDGREGLNYLWTREQLIEALGEDDGAFAARMYGLDDGPNFRDPHHPEAEPSSVLVLGGRPERIAEELDMPLEAFNERRHEINRRLLEARSHRKQPGTDDKILSGWNGMAIRALAEGAIVLSDLRYQDAAERSARFILANMRTRDGVLLRVHGAGQARIEASLEDYAFLIDGLIAVHRTSALSVRAEPEFIIAARELMEIALERFSGPNGALYDTAPNQRDLIVRLATTQDGAMPSGQSVMLHNLIELHEITRDRRFLERAEALLGAMSQSVRESPVDRVNGVRALLRLLRIDPGLPDRLGPRESSEATDHTPVEVLAQVDRVQVPEHGEAKLAIRLRMGDGYHIAAPEPGVPGVQGVQIDVVGSDDIAANIDWPEPKPLGGDVSLGDLASMQVYEGDVDVVVRLQRLTESVQGRPMLLVRYQACTMDACEQARTVELDVAIDV